MHVLISVCKSCMCKRWIYFNSRRVKEYVQMGLDTIIIDPDKGANIARKLDKLQKSGVNDNFHINLRTSPELPKTGWTSNLAELPFVTFATLYQHFVEQPINTILMGDNAENSGTSEDSASDESKDEYIPSFRGLGKGYSFFKDMFSALNFIHCLIELTCASFGQNFALNG